MMKRFFVFLILSLVCTLSAAEQVPLTTIPWKTVPDQTEIFARSGKSSDVSCNEYALTLYVRGRSAGEEIRVLIAPGNEKMQGYVEIRCKTLPKRSLKTVFRVVPDLFSENIEAEIRTDGTGQYVYRITVPWENLSTILPEKELRVMIGGSFLLLLMPEEYSAAKRRIEDAIYTAFQQRTSFRVTKKEHMSHLEILKQYLEFIENDPAVRVRYLRARFSEVKE